MSDDPDDPEGNGDGSAERGDDDTDDDWFERALRDAENAEAQSASSPGSQTRQDAGSRDAASEPSLTDVREDAGAPEGADDPESAFADVADDEPAGFDEAFEDLPEPNEDAGFDDLLDPDRDDAFGDVPTGDADEQDDEGGLFDTDFASALGDAPDLPAESTGGSSGSELGGGSPGGGFGGSAGPGGFGEGGGEFDMATDDVDALGDLDDVGPPGGSDFERQAEGYESEIPRIELGVEGLDAMIQGGVPERSLMVAIGGAGTGKTTLGLQFLDRGLREGERAVYITLEESRRRVLRSATEKGFPYDEYADEGRLAVVDIDPVEMANSLQSIRNELPRLIDEFGASRLVLDSVSLLEMMYEDRAVRRNEIYDFTRSLKDAGVTTLLTSEASEDSAFASRHGIVEYLTDAVFVLRYVRASDFRETRLAIEIQKIRDANHSRETKPYEITNAGIDVYRQANIF